MSGLRNIVLKFWRKIRETGVDDGMPSTEAKRIRFANLIMFPIAAPALPFGAYLWTVGAHELALLQIPFVLFFLTIPLLNARGFYQLARFVLVLGSLAMVVCMSVFSAFESGEHLTLIVILLLAFCVFDIRQYRSLGVCFLLVIASFVMIEYVDAAGLVAQQQGDLRGSYMINFLLMCFALVLAIYYFKSLSRGEVEDIIFRAQHELRAVFENSVDAILLLDPETFTIEMCNDRAVSLFDVVDKEALWGQSLDALSQTPASPDFYGTSWEVREENSPFLRPSGEVFWGNAVYSRLQYDAMPRIMVRITDITSRIRAEAALQDAQERETKALAARDYFLSMMSHELRTPVNGILGVADFLADEKGGDDEFVQMLKLSSRRLMHTVSNMLEMTKHEIAAVEYENEEVALHTVVDPVVTHYRAQAAEKGLTLVLEPQDAAFFVMGRTAFLKQVFENVISNAVKFTHRGHVSVRVFEKEEPDYQVVVEVEDTGIGMSPTFVEQHLFAKFEQESKGMNRRYEGLGLGMTVCKRVIEMMDGTIAVQSERGRGTTIRITLPLVRSDALYPASTDS